MEQKNIVYGVLAVAVACGLVFVLYQQQEAQPAEDYELGEEDLEESWYVDADPAPVEEGSILQPCGQQETSYKRDLCWRFEAFDYQDPERCLNIEYGPDRIICIRSIARDFVSLDIQEKLGECEETYSDDNPGYYACISPYDAQFKNDKLAICNEYFSENISQKYRCHAEVARELLDYDICYAISDQAGRENCVWIVDFENPGVEVDEFTG